MNLLEWFCCVEIFRRLVWMVVMDGLVLRQSYGTGSG